MQRRAPCEEWVVFDCVEKLGVVDVSIRDATPV